MREVMAREDALGEQYALSWVDESLSSARMDALQRFFTPSQSNTVRRSPMHETQARLRPPPPPSELAIAIEST
jgi:hypothetical protein